MPDSDIVIRGAREHNLRDVSVTLPRNQLIVMTGVSGSGKSSLAFDTLYAEGQRRYVESLSSYARQFLGQMPKPEVDVITGLAPSISIQQKTSGRNPRSTVGTITEIYDYLRVLFARVGQGTCPKCERPITAQSSEQIIESLLKLPEGTRFMVLAPMIQRQKGEYRDLFEDLLKQGYLRARVDGRVVQLTENLQLDKQMRHTIEVVIDRLKAAPAQRTRLAEAVEAALGLGQGTLLIATEADGEGVPIVQEADATQEDAPPKKRKKTKAKGDAEGSGTEVAATTDKLYSSRYACTHCGISYEPPSPQLFSFNSPQGMCLECNGLGMRHDFDLESLIADDALSLNDGALALLGSFDDMGRWRQHLYEGVANAIEKDFKLKADTLLDTPWKAMPEAVRQKWLYGTGDRNITYTWNHGAGAWKHGGVFIGLLPELLDEYRKTKNPMRRKQMEKHLRFVGCAACAGSRLNPQARAVTLTSASPEYPKAKSVLSLTDVCSLTIADAAEFFKELQLDAMGQLIAEEVLKEIRGRLGFLLKCGLDYLSLDRAAPTLSGGETQRIRLASQIGCGLVGVVYILDEPSIGLHPRDNDKLLNSLLDLRDQGNTVIVVEHDEETMLAADYIVDFGPGPGVRGGEVVADGSLEDIRNAPRSVTGKYLSGELKIAVPAKRRPKGKKALKIVGARQHNLRNIDVTIPLEGFVCITGVSGSGKSSLVTDILWEVLNRELNGGDGNPGAHKEIKGLEHLDKAIDIDQSPIGRTPRSNPATYVKLFDLIRDLYTELPESKLRGYKPGRFSFNVPGGRCEACEGNGANKLEMDFLADVWVPCPVCNGHRFSHETLEVRFKELNIADVLELDIQQGLEHFANHPKIAAMLQTLHDVGLDYLKLGQASPTLSGGEAQRVKLARELGKRATGRTIYLLDEPTTGLHFADVHKLLDVLHGFVDAGNTVLVVEHNLDVIKTADWVIDLGPEGGAGGGTIVAQGTPEEIAKCEASYTGRALRTVLKGGPPSTTFVKGANRSQGAGVDAPIVIQGATQHNLQGVNLELPRHKLSVFCGPSGSGKSSLAMDTLYAEGQRRYVESLSSYARQFLGQMPKPKVEHVSGLSPAIAIEQKTVGHTPRSTVGTVTEIYDYFRILFARLGDAYCPDCNIPVKTQTTDEVIDKLLTLPQGTRLLLTAPHKVEVGQSYEKLWERLKLQGFRRVRVDGETYNLEDVPELDRRSKHDVAIVVDRVSINRATRGRLADSVESTLDLGKGWMHVVHVDDAQPETQWRVEPFSLHKACRECGRSFPDLTPHSFSFNSALGWCPACEGLGVQQGTNLSVLISDPKLTLRDGAVAMLPHPQQNELMARIFGAMSQQLGLPLDVAFDALEPRFQRVVLYGAGERWIDVPGATDSTGRQTGGFKIQYKGLYPAVEEAGRLSVSHRMRLEHLSGEVACSVCNGSRLRSDAAAVQFYGKTLQQLAELPLGECLDFLEGLKLKGPAKKVAGDLLKELTGRMSFLVNVGLHYLTLSRTMPTLSGGESQRIRLAGQIGRALTGVLYVLDEPTIGLHPRDNGKLLQALEKLRDLGNTLVLVEHDREVLEAADRLYDFGPGAGRLGGTIVGEGSPKQLSKQAQSLTGRYLSNREGIPVPITRRVVAEMNEESKASKKAASQQWLELRGARHHNLRDVELRIPLGTLTCITGVSGSGKSSLIEETLARAVAKKLHHAREQPGPYYELRGVEFINKVIQVDQQPLGSTPASNPATYTGVFEHIRDLFCRLPEAKIRGYRPARFSFNRAGGRCEVCEGNGQKKIEMHFLPDVWVECDVCRGKRFNAETLAVKFHDKSIADVLDMPIDTALELFKNIPKVRGILATLSAVGLGYLTLGQSAATLSGGEAQRVKLAAELARPQTGRTLYLLDEPTTGLHFDDIRKLLKVLHSLVEQGNSVVVIEHNLDVIKTADWVIDVGPEAGKEGGRIVAQGTPEDVVAQALRYVDPAVGKANGKTKIGAQLYRSYTGELLAPVLEAGPRGEREVFDAEEASRKKAGDLDLRQVGKGAKMPWQTDGRRWHTQDRVSHTGAKCRWEGAALALVVDAIESDGGFGPVNWNDRSVIEVIATGQGDGWFFHGLTGDEWLLTLKFRVARNTFKEAELQKQLNLTALDDLDELPVYGRSDRVRVENLKGPGQEVTISVHWLREIDTPEFKAFLKAALESCRGKSEQMQQLNIQDLTPWKVLGRKWHLSRKGFPSNKRVAWDPALLEELEAALKASIPNVSIDWSNKSVAYFNRPATTDVWASLYTKRRLGIDLALIAPAGKVALGRFSTFGVSRDLVADKPGWEVVQIRFDDPAQVTMAFREFLREHALI